MRKLKIAVLFCLFVALLHGIAQAGTYTLVDGQTVVGDPISYDQKGVVFKANGQVMERILWSKFTQDALKQLREDAKTPRDKAFVEPLIEEEVQQKAKAKEIIVKPVQHVERPTGRTGFVTLFSSPLGLFILLLVYAAPIYAGYEVARFKNQTPALVAGLSAIPFLGFVVPIIFLFIPEQQQRHVEAVPHIETDAAQHEATHYEPAAPETPEASSHAAPPPPQAPASAPTHAAGAPQQHRPAAPAQTPATTFPTFRRGEFTFNRRFFETKFAGFARAVLAEPEKDSVLYVKSLRGEFIGRKISSLTQNELVLQIFKGEATADETIPYTEISEVQVRPKDAA